MLQLKIKKNKHNVSKTTYIYIYKKSSDKICQYFLKRLKKKTTQNKQTKKKTTPNNKYISEVFHLLKKPDSGPEDGKDVTRAGGRELGSDLQAGEDVCGAAGREGTQRGHASRG